MDPEVSNRRSAGGLVFLIAMLQLLCFGLLGGREQEYDIMALIIGGGSVLILLFQYALLTGFFPEVDRHLLVLTQLFAAIGLIMQYRLDADTALKQLIWLGGATVAMIVALLCVVYYDKWEKFRYVFMLLTLILLPLSIVFGREVGGSKNWLQFSGFNFQPSELGKVLVVFILAAFLREKRSVWRLSPVAIFVLICLGMLVYMKDLGAALLYFVTFVMLLYIATSNLWLTGACLGAGAAGAVASYYLFSHIRVRVAIWRNPWAQMESAGYQIVQALMAIASGGMFGLGLGQGLPRLIPARKSQQVVRP
jgi:cell division protein FtsW (lipid II flippase)